MKHRILIVDDEPGIRDSLSGVLEDEGFLTSSAASGDNALRCSPVLHRPIQLDVWLPAMVDLKS